MRAFQIFIVVLMIILVLGFVFPAMMSAQDDLSPVACGLIILAILTLIFAFCEKRVKLEIKKWKEKK